MSRIVFNSAHSLKYFPNNKPNDFTVNIPIKLSAIGRNLEVTLNEITFPSGFINVRNGYNEISAILAMDEGEELTVDETTKMDDVELTVDETTEMEGEELTVDETTEMPRINFKIEPNFYNPTSLIDKTNLELEKMHVKLNNQGWISAPLRALDEGEELTVDEITEMPRINFKIEPNFYNPKSLIDEINLKIDKASMEIGINEDNNRGWITANKKIRVKFGLDIAKILGFNSGEWLTFGPEKTISPNHAGAYKNMSLLNVYCNIVEESIIGENKHQLLRLVNWNYANKNVSSPSILYTYPYFIPVKHTNVSVINFKITDSLNIPIEFIGDEPLVIILEFRER